jgi:hypothetical protein
MKQAEVERQNQLTVQEEAAASVTTTASQGGVTETIETHNGYTVSNMEQAIIMSESGGNPLATNGKYVGLFQLDIEYFDGQDWRDVNVQREVFAKYVSQRYGGIDGAWEHWKNFGWY